MDEFTTEGEGCNVRWMSEHRHCVFCDERTECQVRYRQVGPNLRSETIKVCCEECGSAFSAGVVYR